MALPDFRVAQTTHGGPPEIRHRITLAGETFSAGQVVKLDAATGHLEEAASAGVSLYGVALADADPGNEIPVAPFVPGTVFSAKNTGTAFVLATHGDIAYDLEVNGGVHGVDVAAVVGPAFKVLGLDTTEDSSQTERVLVTCLDSVSEAAGGDKDPV